MSARKERKVINGITHIRCSKCNNWTPMPDDYRVYMCHSCRTEYLLDYRKRKKAGKIVPKSARKKKQAEKELKGGPIQGGLFSGCTDEQRKILLNGTVEDLLKLEVER
ncbi:MAG: hypothetical protein P8X74_03865 [Reinekea sp.]